MTLFFSIVFWILLTGVLTEDLQATTPSQEKPPCPNLRAPANGSVVIWGNNILVEYVCDEGMFAIGPTFGSCDTNRKKWTVKRPTCVSPDCDQPSNVTNGEVYLYHNGGVATTVCDPGYKLAGSRSVYCNGYKWVGFRARCRDMYPSSKKKLQGDSLDESGRNSSLYRYQNSVEAADNTCSRYNSKPPELGNATVKVGYAYNSKRRQWVMMANYTCEEGFELRNNNSNHKYCKNYKWLASEEPECIAEVRTPPNPCDNKNGGCEQVCVPHQGSRFNCECYKGYALLSNFKWCKDIDECRFENGGCQDDCHNLQGTYFCTCRAGYILSGKKCLDEDECSNPEATLCEFGCINIPGSYRCNCSVPGYKHSWGWKSCSDVDECAENNGDCEQLCVNTHGSYTCKCNKGYSMSENGTCTDINECEDMVKIRCKGGTCFNTVGSYYCQCGEGYKQRKSKRKCIDIDECALPTSNTCDQKCVNVDGGYACDCLPGYALTSFDTCGPCSVGYYRSLSETECTPCPFNTTTIDIATTSVSGCDSLPGFQGNLTDTIENSTSTTDLL